MVDSFTFEPANLFGLVNLTTYRYPQLVLMTTSLTQHLNSIVIFLVLFSHLYYKSLSSTSMIIISESFIFFCYLSWMVYVRRRGQEYRYEGKQIAKSGIIFVITLLAISPILKTLTEDISSDTIWSMAGLCFLLNACFNDHRISLEWEPKGPNAIALNAAVFGSVILASRLPSNIHVFGITSFAVLWFGLLPILTRSLKKLSSVLYHALITVGFSLLAFLLCLTVSISVARAYTISYLSITFLVPWLYADMQKLKNQIHGPWDEAKPEVRKDQWPMASNPLLILRQELSVNPNSPVTFHGSSGEPLDTIGDCAYIKIGPVIFKANAPTSFKSKRGTGPYYTIESVGFLFFRPEIRDLSYTEYIQMARKFGANPVSLVDKKDLVNYILGSEVSSVDPNAGLVPAFSSFEEAANFVVEDFEKIPVGTSLLLEPAIVTTKALQSRNSIFVSNKDFSFALNLTKDIFSPVDGGHGTKPATDQNTSLVDSIRQANVSVPRSETKKSAPKIPIIVVPAAPTSLVTLYNVQKFLVDGTFMSSTDAKQQSTTPKPNSIQIQRKEDNPLRLSLDDWSRVKAVFVQGPAWQFKGWKWENPADLFQSACGFYLRYDDTAPDNAVKAWNVVDLPVGRSRRHLDSTAQLKFWEVLDRFLESHGF